MPRQNYRQAKRHREESRKKRQLEKRQKKLTRTEDAAPAPGSAVEGTDPGIKAAT
jgi:hypothetical protein